MTPLMAYAALYRSVIYHWKALEPRFSFNLEKAALNLMPWKLIEFHVTPLLAMNCNEQSIWGMESDIHTYSIAHNYVKNNTIWWMGG